MKTLSSWGPSRVQKASERKALIIMRREGMPRTTTERLVTSLILTPPGLSALTKEPCNAAGEMKPENLLEESESNINGKHASSYRRSRQ